MKMRTILDTNTGYGTACVTDVKGAGDKYAISSAVAFLKELKYSRFPCRDSSEPYGLTLRRDLDRSSVLLISACRGL